MKVSELINILLKKDPETIILVNGYEGGLEEPQPPKDIFVCLNEEKDHQGRLPWWEGKYQESFNSEDQKAVLIPRNLRFN
jgi:hypothetical protein